MMDAQLYVAQWATGDSAVRDGLVAVITGEVREANGPDQLSIINLLSF